MNEINLKDLFHIILRRWWIILISTVILVFAVGMYTYFYIVPVYQADTTVYVGKDQGTTSTIAYNDLMVGSQLVNDYREFVKSRKVADRVISELNLKDTTSDQLSSRISVDSKQDTRVIQISVQDTDPVMAGRIADRVALVFTEMVTDVMKIENVQVIDKAELPKSPAKPNKKMNIAIAAVVGIMLGFGIIFLIEYFDDTVKTPEDVQKYTELPVIGTIPVFPNN